MELTPGSVTNLGIGISTDVASVVAKEGYIDSIILTTETGAVEGVSAAAPNFGSAYNPERRSSLKPSHQTDKLPFEMQGSLFVYRYFQFSIRENGSSDFLLRKLRMGIY